MGGDGLLGAVAGELRGTDGVLGVLPGGRGNDFARKLGIGPDPERACDVLAARPRARDRRRRGRRPHVPRDRVGGLRLRRAGHRERDALPLGELVYVYATLRALRGWRHARWQVVVDGEAQSFDGYSVAVANSGVFGGGMYLVPGRVARRRAARRRADARDVEAQLPRAACRRSSRAPTSTSPSLTFLRGREIAFHADRPFAAYADGDPIADLPVTIRVVPRALKVLVP